MLRAGDVYRLDIPGEKTDHFWIMVTDVDTAGRIAYAMLTDARNLDYPKTHFAQGTPAWSNFALTKNTTVDAARSGVREAALVEHALRLKGQYRGEALPSFLEAVREALRKAPETPTAVKELLSRP